MADLRKQIGELFVVGFHGTKADDNIKKLIRDYHVSGIILFSRNIKNALQLATLTNELQSLAQGAGYEAPLLICLDQENGVIRRITTDVALLPGAMTIAATNQPQNAHRVYAASANELRQLGINWNLAPDADINNNPTNPVIGVRSFGDVPEQVAEYVQQAVRGSQEQGVATCLKHFPGHGNTTTDSHQALPTIQQTKAGLDEVELIPFKAGIRANASAIMVAHVLFPAVDAELPASLSAPVMTTLLRHHLNYQGVIVSDDLEMLAIADHYGTAHACTLALKNGADLVMVSHVFATQLEALAAVAAAAATGELNAEQLAASRHRVQQMRTKFGRWQNKFSAPTLALNVRQDQQLAHQIYQKSLTVLRTRQRLTADKPLVLVNFTNITLTKAVDQITSTDPLDDVLCQHQLAHQTLTISLDQPLNTVDFSAITPETIVIVGTTNIRSAQDIQIQVLTKLVALTSHVINIALRNPYDYNWLPAEVTTCLATYENTPAALAFAIDYLQNKATAPGRLPVRLNQK